MRFAQPLAVLAAFAMIALPCAALASEAPAKEKEKSKEQRRITSAETYVPSPTLSAPVTSNYQFAGLMIVDVGFDVPDAKLRARVTTLQPRLTDAMRSALADYTYARFRAGSAPDPDRIVLMLQQAADRTLGVGGAKVLLANVMVQRGR
jgi:flagellar basal body-associated protein FliL